MEKTSGDRLVNALTVAVILVAAALRLINLNFHSLDLDESVSVWLAQKPTGQLIANTVNLSWDPHPPGYYLILKGWITAFGHGEFSVRLLSALFGVVFVWLVFLVGKRLFGPWTGSVAAALTALNPLLVWLSQEVRMYMPVAALTLGSIYCLLCALDKRQPGWWAGYAFLALAGCYCHLFASLLLPVAAIYVLIRGWRHRSLWITGAIVIGIVALGYLPFARNAWSAGRVAPEINVYPDLDLGEQVFELAQSFTTRFVRDRPQWIWIPLLFLAATILIGLWPPGTKDDEEADRLPRLLVFAWLAIPLLAFFWINERRPAFNPKYLVVIVPAFWLSIAAGIVRVKKWSTWLILPALVPTFILSGLGWQYIWNSQVLREDWRTAASYVAQHATEEDQVFVHVHYAHIPFEYYYDGPAEVFAPLGSRPPEPEDLDGLLAPYGGANVLWLVQAQEHNTDPKHVVERWFYDRGPIVTEQYPRGMSVKAYALRYRLGGTPATALPAQVQFGSRLRLIGYELDQSHLRPDSDRLHPPSNWIHLTLYWQIDQPLDGDFATMVEMTDDQGGVWGGKLEQSRNVLYYYQPSSWRPGEVVRDDYDINLNPATPTGMYHIRIGVTGAADGLFWPVSGAATSEERAILTDVQIENVNKL
jgi:mannosyltransferase